MFGLGCWEALCLRLNRMSLGRTLAPRFAEGSRTLFGWRILCHAAANRNIGLRHICGDHVNFFAIFSYVDG